MGTPSFIEIDELQLDKEWIEQPRLFMKWALKAADARHEVDVTKAKLELIRAELDQLIRKKPKKYGLLRVSEASVEAAVVRHPKFQAAQLAYIEAKHNLYIYDVPVNALEHRKKGLENLVVLDGRNYYSEPRIKKGEGNDEESRQNVRRKMRDSRRREIRKRGQK